MPSTPRMPVISGVPSTSELSARRGRDSAWFTSISQTSQRRHGQALVPVPPFHGHGVRHHLHDGPGHGRFSEFLDERHRVSILASHVQCWRTTCHGWRRARGSAPARSRLPCCGDFSWGHRYGQLPGLANSAVLYVEEVTRPEDPLPRFVPEFVMAQLESDTNLDLLPSPSVRTCRLAHRDRAPWRRRLPARL